MRRLLAFLFLTPLLLTGSLLPAQEAKQEEKKTEAKVYRIPYRITPVYHVLARVKINEKGPFNVIIDSGCNIVIMTPSAARQFGLGGASGGKLDKIEFEGGPVILNNRVNINSPPQTTAINKNNAEGTELHGVIGYDILRHYKIDLDYSNHKMTWTQGGDDAKAEPDPKAITVPFEMSGSNHMFVKVHLNGKGPYRFLYDTGSPGVVVSPKLVQAVNKAAMIETLEMGGLKAEKVPVVALTPPNFGGGATDGIIGFPLIARYRTTMDFKSNKIIFSPGSYEPPFVTWAVMTAKPPRQPEPAPSAEDTWGIVVEKGDGKPGITLKKVLPATPAHALGLRSGDRLLVFDDTWTDTVLDVDWATSKAGLGPGVGAKVLRDGKEVNLSSNR